MGECVCPRTAPWPGPGYVCEHGNLIIALMHDTTLARTSPKPADGIEFVREVTRGAVARENG